MFRCIAMKHQGQCLTTSQREFLMQSLKTDLRPEYCHRIEIMLLADEGHSQTQICQALGCAQETARYWISMAKAGQAHQWSDRTIGRPQKIDDRYRQRLKELANSSPREHGYAFQHWTGQWLAKQLARELEIEISGCHVNRLLKEMGLSSRLRKSANE